MLVAFLVQLGLLRHQLLLEDSGRTDFLGLGALAKQGLHLKLEEIIALTRQQRSERIDEAANTIEVPPNIDPVLHSAFQRSRVLNDFLEPFIRTQIDADRVNEAGSILELNRQEAAIQAILDSFTGETTRWINDSFSESSYAPGNSKNIYELSDARIIANANKISRYISTKMGTLWEELAAISPYVVDPETDFGVIITGIDAIVLDEKLLYAQLKTQKNTLTGSQKPRSVAELTLHDNPLFVACIDTNCSWTFSSTPGITRLLGKEFWDLIGMDYELLIMLVARMVRLIEREYTALSSSDSD